MVGVPCLFLCHLGPISRMVWPNFSLCSSGMSQRPSRAVMAKEATVTVTNRILFIPNPSYPWYSSV